MVLLEKRAEGLTEGNVSESEIPLFISYPNWKLGKEWMESRYTILKELFFNFFLFFFFFFDDCFEIIYRKRRKTNLTTISQRENSCSNIENWGISKGRGMGNFSEGNKSCYLLYSSLNYILTLELVLQYKCKNITKCMHLLP